MTAPSIPPPDEIPDGLFLELRNAYEALYKRIDQNNQPHLAGKHFGTPDWNNLPPGEVNVWLTLDRANISKEESTFAGDAWNENWAIFIVVRDNTSQHGTNPFKGLRVTGHINTNIRETLDDHTLDGSINVQETVTVEHVDAPVDDAKIDAWRISIQGTTGLINTLD